MPEPAVGVTLWALWRGVELAGAGTIALAADAIVLSAAPARLIVPVADLDGAHVAATQLTLFHGSGDIVEMTASTGLPAMGRAIVALACEVPELTVPLRALGSRSGRPGVDHDRFFGPFLAARRAAARASDPEGRLAAVDPSALASGVGRVVRELAAERYPKQPAERRAMEAELADLAQPVVESLERLGEAAEAFRGASEDARFSRWREWSVAFRDVFRCADQCWLKAINSALGPRTAKGGKK